MDAAAGFADAAGATGISWDWHAVPMATMTPAQVPMKRRRVSVVRMRSLSRAYSYPGLAPTRGRVVGHTCPGYCKLERSLCRSSRALGTHDGAVGRVVFVFDPAHGPKPAYSQATSQAAEARTWLALERKRIYGWCNWDPHRVQTAR